MDDIIQEAKLFLEQYFFEKKLPGVQKRIQEVVSEIHETGTYRHTFKELSYGAKMAWRNSNRCIGRLFWRSLHLIDARDLIQPEEIFRAVQNHLTTAYNHGKIKPLITIFLIDLVFLFPITSTQGIKKSTMEKKILNYCTPGQSFPMYGNED